MSETAVLLVAGLEVATALGIAVFWTTWFRSPHDQTWLPEGYVRHERAFVVPDTILSVLLVVSAVLVWTRAPMGRTLSLVCAGMLAFLGAIDAAYYWQNGLFARQRDGIANACVVGAVLTLSVTLIVLFA